MQELGIVSMSPAEGGVELVSDFLKVDIAYLHCSFEGVDFYSALLDGRFDHVTRLEFCQDWRVQTGPDTYCSRTFGHDGFSKLLFLILQTLKQLDTLVLRQIQVNGPHEFLFSALPHHPPDSENYSVTVLELKYMNILDEDVKAIGECFTSVQHLVW